MYVGSMNFPGRSVAKEVHRIAEEKFDFIDLTLEPPAAWLPDAKDIGRLIGELGLFADGHTAWYLPIASPFPERREKSHDLYKKSLDAITEAGGQVLKRHRAHKASTQWNDR